MTVQNYIGLDARIESIVRALLGDIDVDLSDFYTKEEVDALIASGGTGLQINYNDLLNRPIIDGLLQSSLDLNGHFLLYNSQRLYCPAVIENIITFDADVSIPNVYTKAEVDALIAGGGEVDAYTKAETDGLLALKANVADVYSKAECDEKFGGGGSIPDPLNVNNLTVSKRLNIQSKDTTDVSVKGFIQVAGRNTSEYYLSMGLQYGIIDVYPDRVDYSVNNVRFGTSDIVELNYNKETQRNLLSAEHTLDIQAPSISFNGTLENIYTKQEVKNLIAGGIETEYIQTKKVFLTTRDKLSSYLFTYEENEHKLYLVVDDRDAIAKFDEKGLTYFSHTRIPFSITRDSFGFDIIASKNHALQLLGNDVYISGDVTTGRVVLEAKDIVFNGTLANVYTKAEVDALIGGGGGGGGGTYNYLGPDNQMDEFAYDGTKMWSLGFPQRAGDKPQALYGLRIAEQNGAYASVILTNFMQKYVGIGDYDNLDNLGFRFYTATNTLFIDGPIQASSVEAQTGLVVNGPSTLTMRTVITDLNINGSNCNVYTKAEVDAKVEDVSKRVKVGGQIVGTWDNINNTIKSSISNGPSGFYIFQSNHNTLKPLTILTVANAAVQRLQSFAIAVENTQANDKVFIGLTNSNNTQEIQEIKWVQLQTVQASQTITHEAPYVGEADEYSIGDPVFASGRVCRYDMTTNEWTTETAATDCICEVKPEGTVGEYMGICVGFNENTKSLIFATHGDYYFNVADSSKYKIGDIILLDGSVLKDDMALTGKVMKMIVGKITGKINKTTVAVLKD